MDVDRQFILIVLLFVCAASVPLELEAERGDFHGTGVVKPRSAASNLHTVMLQQGGYITLQLIKTTTSCTLTLQNVAYTNDGASDTVTLTLNGTTMGSFRTLAATNYGHLWNVVRNSGTIGQPIHIASGAHTMRVTATSADNHGVEIDRVDLNFNQQCHPDIAVSPGLTPAATIGVSTAVPITFSIGCPLTVAIGACKLLEYWKKRRSDRAELDRAA